MHADMQSQILVYTLIRRRDDMRKTYLPARDPNPRKPERPARKVLIILLEDLFQVFLFQKGRHFFPQRFVILQTT